jgi:hypothetical protein
MNDFDRRVREAALSRFHTRRIHVAAHHSFKTRVKRSLNTLTGPRARLD